MASPLLKEDGLPNKHPKVADVAWEVFLLLKADSSLSTEEVGARLDLSGRQVRAHLATLKEAGLIERQGSRKVGRWVVKG